MEAWAKRLQARMEELGESAATVARACKIKDASVSGWFGRGAPPTKMIKGDNLLSAARFLRTTPEWILTGKGGHTAAGTSSQFVGLDPATLSDAVALLNMLADYGIDGAQRIEGLNFDAIATAYTIVAEAGETVDPSNVVYLSQVLAKRLREQTNGVVAAEIEGTGGATRAPARA